MCLLFIFSYELDSALFFSDTGVIKEFWCIPCMGKRKGNDFHKTWMGSNNVVEMYGDSLQDQYLSSKNKSCPSWFLSYRWCRGNMQFSRQATCGSRLPSGSQMMPHYHKKLILSSARLFCLVFDIIVAKCSLMCCFCAALLRAAVSQTAGWIL